MFLLFCALNLHLLFALILYYSALLFNSILILFCQTHLSAWPTNAHRQIHALRFCCDTCLVKSANFNSLYFLLVKFVLFSMQVMSFCHIIKLIFDIYCDICRVIQLPCIIFQINLVSIYLRIRESPNLLMSLK